MARFEKFRHGFVALAPFGMSAVSSATAFDVKVIEERLPALVGEFSEWHLANAAVRPGRKFPQ